MQCLFLLFVISNNKLFSYIFVSFYLTFFLNFLQKSCKKERLRNCVWFLDQEELGFRQGQEVSTENPTTESDLTALPGSVNQSINLVRCYSTSHKVRSLIYSCIFACSLFNFTPSFTSSFSIGSGVSCINIL